MCQIAKINSQTKIENIFFEQLLPKTKPISIAIVYKPPTDNRYLGYYLSKGFNELNLMENDLFILSDINVNIIDNGHNILDKYKDTSKKNLILVLFLKSMHRFVLL